MRRMVCDECGFDEARQETTWRKEVKCDDILYTLLIPRYSSAVLEEILHDAITAHYDDEPLTIYIDILQTEITTCTSCMLFNIRNRRNRDKVEAYYEQIIMQEVF